MVARHDRDAGGKRLAVRDWARQLGVNHVPGIVLFDNTGKDEPVSASPQ